MIDRIKIIGFLGIGIFTYKTISSLTYTLEEILKSFLIYLNLEPSWTFWLSQLLGLILFVLLVNFIINWIFNNYELISNNVLNYFTWSFSAYFIIQVIQIAYPSLISYFELGMNNDGIMTYYNHLKDNSILYIVKSILYYLGEIIVIMLIYNKAKNGSRLRTE